tara:strand:+ start:132 stop:356 length:225 start_codon:yes stop_codon:yes gene_type:complete
MRFGLWKGAEASAVRSIVFSGARLGLYEPIKTEMTPLFDGCYPLILKFSAGALSGLLASVTSNPLEILKVRMQA